MNIELVKGRKANFNRLLLTAVEHGRPVIILFMVVVFSVVLWFIYQNVYVPLTRAVELAELKETTAVVRPDDKLLKETLEALARRTAPIDRDWQVLRNPFTTPPPTPIATPVDPTIDSSTLDELGENL